MTAEAVQFALCHAGWSVGERSSVLGHVAEADRGEHRISVAARTSRIAGLAVWAKPTGPRLLREK